jgi:DNA-binding MarR family transcriptional regulator
VLQLRKARTRIARMPRSRTKETTSRTPSLQTLLSEASRKATADLERVLRPKGVPVEYWRVLEVLADENGRSMSSLADTVAMRLPTLSKLIDRMVADALVQRAADPQDLRRVLVYISDPGLQLVTGLRSKVRRQRSALEASLGQEHGAALKRLLAAFIGSSRS